ncbi:MAG: hypothetical protein DMF10_07890 [Verrucomicrobia bacterium]|nr:MAG: hypothetical protein DMF10_07890 [Verrucomicrobiota bacterium]
MKRRRIERLAIICLPSRSGRIRLGVRSMIERATTWSRSSATSGSTRKSKMPLALAHTLSLLRRFILRSLATENGNTGCEGRNVQPRMAGEKHT